MIDYCPGMHGHPPETAQESAAGHHCVLHHSVLRRESCFRPRSPCTPSTVTIAGILVKPASVFTGVLLYANYWLCLFLKRYYLILKALCFVKKKKKVYPLWKLFLFLPLRSKYLSLSEMSVSPLPTVMLLIISCYSSCYKTATTRQHLCTRLTNRYIITDTLLALRGWQQLHPFHDKSHKGRKRQTSS